MNRINNIEMLYSYSLDQSQYLLPRELYMSALFFNAACAMGVSNIKIKRETNRGDKIIIPNYFGITFSKSGSGKNHALNLTRKIFDRAFKSVVERSESFYIMKANQSEDNRVDGRYIKMSDYYIPVSSSIEGIQKTAQTLSDMKMGSVNIVADEIADTIGRMEQIFTKLKSTWDTGTSEGQVNVSDGGINYFTVEQICFNSLLFGAPGPFSLDAKKMDKLLEYYVSGGIRRSFVYHNNTYKKSENRNQNFETMSLDKLRETEVYIKKLKDFIFASTDKTIEYPQEIFDMLEDYDVERDIHREKSHSIIAEDLGSTKKIEKLMGIIAVLDLSWVITEKHLRCAIAFTEALDATAEETVELKPIYLHIYNLLEQRNFVSRTDIVKNIKNITLRSLESEIVLAIEHASMLGNSIIKKEHSNIVKYKLEKMSKTDLNQVILSINTNMSKYEPSGFVKSPGSFLGLHKVVNGNYRYSAGTFKGQECDIVKNDIKVGREFKDNYISDDNYLEEGNIFIIDVDEDLTLADAKNLFSSMTYLITTTKSHQKEKNGVICDRFRIIFPTLSKFHLDYKTYSETYMNVINALGIPEADSKCKNASRWYYGNPDGEHWYNEGERLDIRHFIPDSAEQIASEAALNKYEKENAPEDVRVDAALKWFMLNTSAGNRHDNVYLLGHLLSDPARIGISDWEMWLEKANSCLGEPLPSRDMTSTIRSIKKKR